MKIIVTMLVLVCLLFTTCCSKGRNTESSASSVESNSFLTTNEITQLSQPAASYWAGKPKPQYFGTFNFEPVGGSVEVVNIKETNEERIYRLDVDFISDYGEQLKQGDISSTDNISHNDKANIGYFLVTKDKIMRTRPVNLKEENAILSGEFPEDSTIIFQTSSKPDKLGESEKGLHEWIEVNNDIVKYRSYNNLDCVVNRNVL